MRLEPTLKPYSPGVLALSSQYSPKVVALCRSIPSATWDARAKVWLIPEEYGPKVAKEVGVAYSSKAVAPNRPFVHGKLFPHQQIAVESILRKRRLILAFEQGLGKTVTAIVACREAKAKRILVVCPAMVREIWEEHFHEWWPEKEVSCRTNRTDTDRADCCITSYELLRGDEQCVDVLIVDESHYSNRDSKRTKKVSSLTFSLGWRALVIFLSGTPATLSPEDIFTQCAILWPGRLGRNKWHFAARYCHIEENKYGKKINGIRPEMEEELSWRLSHMCHRVTKDQVPEMQTQVTMEMLSIPQPVFTGGALEQWVETNLHYKEEHIYRLCIENAKTCVLTNLKSTARKVVSYLQSKGLDATLADGSVPVGRRLRLIKEVAAKDKAVLVTTMHAVNVGINLSAFTLGVFCELYTAPAKISQAAARFGRFGSAGGHVVFLVSESTHEERKAVVICSRSVALGAVISGGATEGAVTEALQYSERDIVAGFLSKLEAMDE